MFPQLNTATFASQIFWVCLGFLCVYGIMSLFAVPRLKKILDSRESYIGGLLDVAKKFSEKSEKIEKDAEEVIAKARHDVLKTEEKLICDLEKKSFEEKQRLSREALDNINSEVTLLKASSEEAFGNISSDLDELINLALQKVGSQKS